MNGKTNFHKISIISYLIYKLRETPVRISTVFLMELEKLYIKFTQRNRCTKNAKVRNINILQGVIHMILNDEKDIFWGCQFQKVLQVFIELFNFASSALLVRAQTWINVILNGLPWKRTVIILLFLRLHPSTAFQTLLLTMIASKYRISDSSVDHHIIPSCPQQQI